MAVVDFEAIKKWAQLPKDMQARLVRNVFCLSCGVTMVVHYTIKNTEYGILLEGECKKCGKRIARLIEKK